MLAFSRAVPVNSATTVWIGAPNPRVCIFRQSHAPVTSRQHQRIVPRAAAQQQHHPVYRAPIPASSAPPAGASLSTGPKEELLAILALPANEQTARVDRIRELLLTLESVPNARPETSLFTEFALAGKWELLFSTSPFSVGQNVRVRELLQNVNSETKEITNSCHWTYVPDSVGDKEIESVDAVIDIASTYAFQGESPLIDVTVKSHQMRVADRSDGKPSGALPDNLQSVIEELQRSLPIEFWDPSGGLDPATFVDPWFRISCQIGRLQGVRGVFRRKTLSVNDA
jgi:hypothetical protein